METNKCNCFIHHPDTKDERQNIFNRLEGARLHNDHQGMLLYHAQLQPCPGLNKKPEKKSIAVMRKELREFSADMARDDKEHCIHLLVWCIQNLCSDEENRMRPTEEDLDDPDKLSAFWVSTIPDADVEGEWASNLGDDDE